LDSIGAMLSEGPAVFPRFTNALLGDHPPCGEELRVDSIDRHHSPPGLLVHVGSVASITGLGSVKWLFDPISRDVGIRQDFAFPLFLFSCSPHPVFVGVSLVE